jgi:hypothetical protein
LGLSAMSYSIAIGDEATPLSREFNRAPVGRSGEPNALALAQSRSGHRRRYPRPDAAA